MTTAARFEHLAAIRGIAAFVVLLAHIVQIFWLRFWGLQSWQHIVSSAASQYAVMTFFVLSGFLIAHSVESNIRRNGVLKLSEFFAARFARLYPPFLFAIVLSVAIYMCLEFFSLPGRVGAMRLVGDLYAARDIIHLPAKEVLTALPMGYGMLEINGPLWSLYMEAKLYVLFAGIYFFWVGRRSFIVGGVLLGVAYAGLRLNPEFARYSAVWLTGCCAYYLWETKGVTKQRSKLVLCFALTLLIVMMDLASPVVMAQAAVPDTHAIWVDVVIACVIAWVLFRLKLRLTVGEQLANYSYTLYATHFPILLLFQSILISSGNTSLSMAVMFSLLGGVSALGIAHIGGKIEEAKDKIQQRLLASWADVDARIRGAK